MRKWLPLMTVCLGTFILLIDVTIVNVALPNMVGDLGASFGVLQWVIDAYALALAALVLGAGSIADLIGHRRVYIAGLAIFAISSLMCGLAPNPGMLIIARTVQGIGAAAMFATTFALLNSAYAGRDRGSAYGIWGAVAGHGIPDAAHVARAIAGGRTPGLLDAAPSRGRQFLDSAAHAAAVTGVQATYVVAGAVGILASLVVIILMRPNRTHAARQDERPPVPQPTRR